MNTSGPTFSAHRDVLDAPVPETSEGQNRLLEELKNRGRSAVQAGNWPDASSLYRKALDVVKCIDSSNTNDGGKMSEVAVLNANLSLTEGKMNLWTDAEHVAVAATEADPMYVKGWWRLGQAQAANGKYDDAVVSLDTGLALEPNNKALQKELTKMKEKAVKEKEEAAKRKELDEKKAELAKNESTITQPLKNNNSTSSKSQTSKVDSGQNGNKKEHSNKKTNDDPMDVDTDGSAFTKSDFVRGYKIVNGKKTSYFHNELSEDAKKLIGDIAPKRLDSTTSDIGNGSTTSTANGGPDPTTTTTSSSTSTSVWNQAGTWEEKDVSNWAQETLENSLKVAVYVLPPSSPAPNAIIAVTKVTAKGHASVASVRGKKRYIYEYSIKIHWNFVHDRPTDGTTTTAEGSMKFPDVDGTCIVGEGYDATNFVIKTATDDTVRPLLDTFVYKQGLRDVLHNTIDDWVRTFQEMY